jgi:hypothetical protein
MKTKILLPALLLLILHNIGIKAQNTFPATGAAGIGTTSPNASSLLEIRSTAKGFLMPRMSLAQRNGIASPATGLLIYQTNSTPGFYYYSGTAWKAVTPKSNDWSLTGNAGTDSSINFIGTTDAHPLVFRINNAKSGLIGYSDANTSFGYLALSSNTSGHNNTATGSGALSGNVDGYNNTAYGGGSLGANTSGYQNTAIGGGALGLNTANDNVAVGFFSLYENTSGGRNTANGTFALLNNTTQSNNSAFGYNALYNNGIGTQDPNAGISNTAVGSISLYNNTTGNNNTALGASTLLQNVTASDNTAIGASALSSNGLNAVNSYDGVSNTAVGSTSLAGNTVGYNNTGSGYQSLLNNTTGYNNAAYGVQSLLSNISGIGNTAIGVHADVGAGNLTNATTIGYFSSVNASNKMQLGSSTTILSTSNGYTIVSDGRFKEQVKDNDVPGLAFINKLRPVTYNFNYQKFDAFLKKDSRSDSAVKNDKDYQSRLTEKAKKRESGFIAQDVDKVVHDNNYTFTGVYTPQNEKDNYALDYGRFVVPLVKAVQELSKMNDDKDAAIDSLKSENESLEQRITRLEALMNVSSPATISSASLQQNIPNPFNHTTTINYTLPQTYSSAKIIVTDNSGKTLKELSINAKGKGSLNIDASTLASGAYQYSLIVDGRLIDTKQMVLAK